MLSWFFSRKRSEKVNKSNPIEQLARILREHGGMILDGKGRLCLTTPVLISLNRDFQQLTFGRDAFISGDVAFQVIKNEGPNDDIPFIFDFVQKSPNLKLVSGPVCVPSPQLSLLPFRSIELLEIHRVPIVYVHGLHHIAKHIKILICHRSTNSVKDVVYQFGRDFNGVLTLPELETLDLSYNTITCLDKSLKLLPSLENLDLCYNCLANADSSDIPPVKYLNLGFNSIAKVPSYPLLVSYSLNKLTLCSNSLTNLEGVEMFRNLETLDVSFNCLVNFDDLLPLARLQFLVSLHVQGNPFQFMPKYRQEVLSRLSPIARMKPVSLDGQMLNDAELLILGMKVHPAPYPSYLLNRKSRVISESLKDLENSIIEKGPVISSTPNGIKPKGQSSKRKSAKVREARIFDKDSLVDSTEESQGNFLSNSALENRDSLQRHGSFGSRRNSLDDTILWIHKNVSGEVVEVSKSLQDIDYATQLDQEQLSNALAKEADLAHKEETNEPDDSIYSNIPVKVDVDSLSVTSGSSISVVTDDEESPVFLVESVSGGDKNFMEDKESLFVIFKHPYLIEKDPITGQVVKLDLNYLREVVPFANGVLRVSLKFDLVRSDRQKRLYLFEDIDHIEEFNVFVSHLTPIALRNKENKESNRENYQCLKCSATFQRQNSTTSFSLCPSCNSSMVVEQNTDLLEEASNSRLTEDDGTVENQDKKSISSVEKHSSNYDTDIECRNLVQRDSSIEVIARTGDPNFPNVSAHVPRPNPLEQEDMSVIVTNDNTQSLENIEKPNDALSERNVIGVVYENGLNDVSIEVSKKPIQEAEHSPENQETSSASDNISSDWRQLGKFKDFLKNKLSGSSISIGSSGEKDSAEDTRCSTPASFGSRVSKSTKSQTMSPFQGASNNDIVVNQDEMTRCDHRLKLYFTMDLFKIENEDFQCLLKCPYLRYDKTEIQDCLLLVSTANIYIFKLRCPSSDSAKEWIHLLVKYRFTELKYIDYGYLNQSFRLEFEREFGSYKFLIGDSERCQKFLSLLLRTVEDGVADKQCLPIVLEDPNPRTLANIRTQVFGLHEDVVSLAKRLFEQATIFTVPSLLKSKKIRMRTHHCVTGKDLVSWLVSRREAKSRKDAIILCQKLVNVGLLYHVSKELQFEDADTPYKFDFSDNPKKMSSAVLQKIGHSESSHSESSFDEMEMNFDVCIYLLIQARISDDDSSLIPRSIFVTKTHIFLASESHQWPLSRIYNPPSFLKEHFKLLANQRIIDLIKMTFFEDSQCHVMLDFVDELGDIDSRESTWLIYIETIREMNRLTNSLKNAWEDEMKVELFSEVLPSINLIL